MVEQCSRMARGRHGKKQGLVRAVVKKKADTKTVSAETGNGVDDGTRTHGLLGHNQVL